MNGSSCDKLDSLISASLHINIADEAKAFLSQDISDIRDDPKLRQTVLRNAEREKPRAKISAFRIAVAACLAAALLLLSACMCIPKIRDTVWGSIVEWYDDHIRIHFPQESGTESDDGSGNAVTQAATAPTSIKKRAYASYLPDGYYADPSENSLLFAGTTFYDRDGNLRFKLMQTTLSEEGSNDLMVDHGNEPVCEQYINGHRGLMIEYAAAPGLYYLGWQDRSYQYSIYGTFESKDELIKIAEGIRTE